MTMRQLCNGHTYPALIRREKSLWTQKCDIIYFYGDRFKIIISQIFIDEMPFNVSNPFCTKSGFKCLTINFLSSYSGIPARIKDTKILFCLVNDLSPLFIFHLSPGESSSS